MSVSPGHQNKAIWPTCVISPLFRSDLVWHLVRDVVWSDLRFALIKKITDLVWYWKITHHRFKWIFLPAMMYRPASLLSLIHCERQDVFRWLHICIYQYHAYSSYYTSMIFVQLTSKMLARSDGHIFELAYNLQHFNLYQAANNTVFRAFIWLRASICLVLDYNFHRTLSLPTFYPFPFRPRITFDCQAECVTSIAIMSCCIERIVMDIVSPGTSHTDRDNIG